MDAPRIVDALATRRAEDAQAIVVEYLAPNDTEAGSPVPQGIADLGPSLHAILASLPQRHAAPGALLIAIDGDEVRGCVGLSRSTTPLTPTESCSRSRCGHHIGVAASPDNALKNTSS
jgi:hypothetical protein